MGTWWEGSGTSGFISDTVNTSAAVKKAAALFLENENGLSEKPLRTFYRSTTDCVTVWDAGCSVADKRAVQRAISSAQDWLYSPIPA